MSKSFQMRFDAPDRRARRALFGLSVAGIGALALLDNLHYFAEPLLRTYWPLVLVVWGLGRLIWPCGTGHRLFGLVLIAAGGLMTAHNLGQGGLSLHQWWPVFIVLAGASIALRGLFPSTPRWRHSRFDSSTLDHGDEVNVDASFSGVQVRNDSQHFKGGRIAISFGGLQLDLREARMDGAEAVLQLRGTFSGIELRVPRDWQVIVQLSATMGAVDDKTSPPAAAGHRLVLRGETLFGGVEVKN